MAARTNALDDLLAEITALVEADGVIKPDFEQQIILVEVHAVACNTGFDSQNILRFCADP